MIKKLNTFKMTYQSNYYVVTKITLNKFRTLGYYKHLKIKNLQSVSRAILNPDLQSVYLQEMRCQGVLTQFLIQLQSSSIPQTLTVLAPREGDTSLSSPSLPDTHTLADLTHTPLVNQATVTQTHNVTAKDKIVLFFLPQIVRHKSSSAIDNI